MAKSKSAVKRTSQATKYALDVLNGVYLVNELVRLAAERHIAMLREVKNGRRDIRWNKLEADAAVDFFSHLRQWKGRWGGEPLTLLPWQAFCVGCIFGWQIWDEELRVWVRLYREAYISVARKNGKTTLIAGIGLWMLDFDGENAAEVYFCATKRDQAKQGWDTAQHIVDQSPSLSRRIRHLKSVNKLIVDETGSVLLPLGRDSDTEHGLNPSSGLIDELHVHRNRDMVDAIETAVGARTQPLIVYTTTAGVEDGSSIYLETDDRARRVVRGIINNPRMFVYIAELDRDDDWTDSSVYAKANPSLGTTIQLGELEEERDKAISTPGRQNSFKRLRLNGRTQSDVAWLDLRKWDACGQEKLWRKGRRHIGVDLGGRGDLSAASAIVMDLDGGIDIDVRFWMPRELVALAEERDGVPYQTWIDQGYITATEGDYRHDAQIVEDLSMWSMGALEFDLDVWNSSGLTTPLQDRGYEVVVVPQTYISLTPAVALLETAVADHKLSHLNNPVLRWMVSNTQLEETRDGGRKPIKMDTKKNRRRIDGVSAVLNALVRVPETVQPLSDVWSWGAT